MINFIKRLCGAQCEAQGPANCPQELDHKPTTGPWIGVDLDGTLAHYDRWRGAKHIGKPVPAMLARVKNWRAQGYRVKIFTARASVPELIPPIQNWLAQQGLDGLEITHCKDMKMIELWDDRSVQVVANTGAPVRSTSCKALPRVPIMDEMIVGSVPDASVAVSFN